MAHVRKQIRDWLKGNLVGSDDAGSRVHVRRTLPQAKDFQPCLLVSLENERSSDSDMDGTQDRWPQVRVTACAKGDAEETEDLLDRLGVFVEKKFAGDPTLGGLTQTYEYRGTEFAFAGEGEKTLCTAAMTFAVNWYGNRNDPETAY